jgi:opacity protein-like surface antigen
MPKYLLTFYLAILSFTLHAQTWEIGASVGGAGYLGDLNTDNPVKLSGISFGGFLKRNFNGYLALKGSLNYGIVHAADSNSRIEQTRNRNLSFTNHIKEAALTAEYNFMHYIPDAGKNRFTPFVFVGGAIALHNPTTIYRGAVKQLRSFRTEERDKQYSQLLIAIPYGAGVKYNIGGKWNLIADIGYRYTTTDYIDDVSGVYPDQTKLPNLASRILSDRSGEETGIYTGVRGTQRGDLRQTDTYFFLNLSISFTFVTQRCYFENR